MFTIAEYSWAQHVNQNKDALEPHFLAFLSSSPLHTCTPMQDTHWAHTERANVKWWCNSIMPQVCACRVNELDMLTIAFTLDITFYPEGHLVLPELCGHVVFPRSPLSVTDQPPTEFCYRPYKKFCFVLLFSLETRDGNRALVTEGDHLDWGL